MFPTNSSGGKSNVVNLPTNQQRRFSINSKKFDNEYNNQRIEVIDTELSQPLPNSDGQTIRRRLTQIITINEGEENAIKPKGRFLLLFILEPIITGCIFFPLLVLFWDCGWNLFTSSAHPMDSPTLY